MTFSFTLVLGLFLLAPGFAIFAAIYHGARLGPVESPPPPPGSILSLAIVTVGALVAHLAGAGFFLLQDLACGRAACLATDHDPNLYASLFDIAAARTPVSGAEAFSLFGTLSGLTLLSFLLARVVARRLAGQAGLKGVLYGWLADVAVAEDPDEAVLAYVVSDVQEDGTVVGYEGVVANMTTNADKEITSILLTACETFYLRVGASGVVRRKAQRTSPIPQLYLDRTRIKNVAFERVRFEGEESA